MEVIIKFLSTDSFLKVTIKYSLEIFRGSCLRVILKLQDALTLLNVVTSRVFFARFRKNFEETSGHAF